MQRDFFVFETLLWPSGEDPIDSPTFVVHADGHAYVFKHRGSCRAGALRASRVGGDLQPNAADRLL